MKEWSFAAELLAFILLLMTAMFYYDKKQVKSLRKILFETGLWLAGASIILNAVCGRVLTGKESFSVGLSMALNSLYFLVSIGVSFAIAAYLFDLILEHVYQKTCRTRAVFGLSLLSVVYLGLVLFNVKSGLLFYFDSHGNYCRGPWNQVSYGIVFIELLMVGICYFRNRASVGNSVKRVLMVLPAITVFLVLFQLAFPDILLNGTIATFALLVLFVNYQNFQAERDTLTETGNRKTLYEELFLRLRGRQDFQIILVSLNNFARVNQQFGYRSGDEFLYRIARWLEECRSGGRVFRFGKVSFALLCPDLEGEESLRLQRRIEERFAQTWTVGKAQCRIQARFGIMTSRNADMDATQMMEVLTFMMEHARKKDNGRVQFDENLQKTYLQVKGMEELLQDGIANRRFEVWYQPIFNCKAGRFDSAEALVRLRDREGRLVSPAAFIPLSEENGMIKEIGRLVWEEVCTFLGSCPELPLEKISVNMSMPQFADGDLCRRMAETLRRNRVPVERTRLEITERVLLDDEKGVEKQMHDFFDQGFRFSMDDFGVGYSNFSGVMHLPFEIVKLDKSLVDTVSVSDRDQLVVESIVELFHNMGTRVVAEGVETKDQQERLRAMGVDYIQGFYYAKPMPKEELLAFLRKLGA